jgi:hypothetical protein
VRRHKSKTLTLFAAGLVIAMAIHFTMLPLALRAATNELSLLPTALHFGDVVVGHTETLLVVVTNQSRVKITVSKVASSNSRFRVSNLGLPKVLAPGATLDVNVTFAPTAVGWVGGQITVVSNAFTRAFSLGGAGVTTPGVTASPATVSFGNVGVGASATVPIILTNTRRYRSLILKSVQISDKAFSVSGVRFPLTLAAGQKVRLSATFRPTAMGLAGGSIFIPGPLVDIPLTGTGTSTSQPQLTVTPATLSFGSVSVGSSATLSAGLRASGAKVIISSASSSSSQFAIPGAEFPLTIPAGQEVLVNVTFKPQSSGGKSAKISFASNATNSPASEALAGTGTSNAPYVSLSWKPSTSKVTGYNVYRSTSLNGSYNRLNSSLDTVTSYTDATIASGATYYYATTAVNSAGEESGYSNRVQVVVP